jgi:outer membrane protein TolC
VIRSAALALAFALPAAAADPSPIETTEAAAVGSLTLAQCIAEAVAESGQVAEARGKLGEWEARLAEARSVWYPKFTGVAFGAPTFGVRGNVLTPDVERDWGDWGPYLRFEGLLAQPLYTFGRADAGERAARERVEVERGQLEVVRQKVALEVQRFYFLHLYARSMQPTLAFIRKSLDAAQAKAQELYDSASGSVTNVDLMKLQYASTEVDKYRVQAEIGAALALAALQHTMGRQDGEPLALVEAALPESDEAPPPLEALVQLALERRPEAAQLRHGKRAAEELEKLESRADLPILALVGQLTASWTPNRDDAKNPYVYDPYNELSGGIGVALKFDVDPARSKAKSAGARSLAAQVRGLERFAATGIPLEVRKARDEIEQSRRLVALARDGSSATRKWMIFAGTAYASGTGETKDVLEGMAAYATARKSYFDALLALQMARAQLDAATGAPLPPPR